MHTIVFAWRQDRVGCGQHLRLLREAASLSQRALAEQADLSISALSRLERGLTAPHAATIVRLAAVLHAVPEDLITSLPGNPDSTVRQPEWQSES